MSGERDSQITGFEETLYKVADGIKFKQLTEQVEKICFGYNPIYPEFETSPNPEAKIIAQLGVYGLRSALDQQEAFWDYSDIQDQEYASELEREILPDTILRLPLKFNQSRSISV